jgi:hypothetical protein
MKSKIATRDFNSRLVALLLAVMLLVTLSQSGAHATSPKLNATQCKQAISSFQGLYFNPNDSTQQWMDGYLVTPLITELNARRNIWKSLESKLSKGPVKSYFQDLISKSFVMLNKRGAIYKPGHTSSTGELGGSIYEITKSCVPGETNEFCKTLSSSFTSVTNLWKGQSISRSGVLNTKRIWSTEVKKWPTGSNSKAWLNRLLINLDEMISEAKAKRDVSGVFTIFLDEWGNLDRSNDVIDFWPCRDRALEALGVKLGDGWND